MKNSTVIFRLALFNLIVLLSTGIVVLMETKTLFGYILFGLLIITIGALDVLLYRKNKLDE